RWEPHPLRRPGGGRRGRERGKEARGRSGPRYCPTMPSRGNTTSTSRTAVAHGGVSKELTELGRSRMHSAWRRAISGSAPSQRLAAAVPILAEDETPQHDTGRTKEDGLGGRAGRVRVYFRTRARTVTWSGGRGPPTTARSLPRGGGGEPANERPVSAAPSEPPCPRIVPGGRHRTREAGERPTVPPSGCTNELTPFAKKDRMKDSKDAGAGSEEIDAIAETSEDEDWTALEPGAAASRLS
ncbi:hypothetical protein THAOC_06527, partial [Thalassiosira oceanica]